MVMAANIIERMVHILVYRILGRSLYLWGSGVKTVSRNPLGTELRLFQDKNTGIRAEFDPIVISLIVTEFGKLKELEQFHETEYLCEPPSNNLVRLFQLDKISGCQTNLLVLAHGLRYLKDGSGGPHRLPKAISVGAGTETR